MDLYKFCAYLSANRVRPQGQCLLCQSLKRLLYILLKASRHFKILQPQFLGDILGLVRCDFLGVLVFTFGSHQNPRINFPIVVLFDLVQPLHSIFEGFGVGGVVHKHHKVRVFELSLQKISTSGRASDS